MARGSPLLTLEGGGTQVVDVVMDPEKLPHALRIAERLQAALQAIDGVSAADIHADLTLIPSELDPPPPRPELPP
jgi:hypothetical protein